MSDLKAFWRFIETGGRTAVLAAWHHEVGEAMALVRPLLCPLDTPVRSYPHLKRPGHWMRVVHHKDGSIVAVAEDDCTFRISLSPQDIIPYRLDIHQLRRHLAQALSIRAFVDDCDQEATSIRIGGWDATPGQSFPVILTMGVEHWLLVRELQRLLLTVRGKFILLTPTQRLWKGDVPTLVAERAVLAALDGMISVKDGIWRANGAWKSCLASFRELAMPHTLVIAPPPNEFRKDGSDWVVRYEGVMKPFADSKGMSYIHYLLLHQGRDVPVIHMLADLTGDKRVRAASNAGEVLTEEAEQSIAERLSRLNAELEKAVKTGDTLVQQEIESEKEEVMQQVLKAHGLGGRKRKMSDDAARIYRAVYGRMRETIDQMPESMKPLAKHLDAFISSGIIMRYEPEKEIDWAL